MPTQYMSPGAMLDDNGWSGQHGPYQMFGQGTMPDAPIAPYGWTRDQAALHLETLKRVQPDAPEIAEATLALQVGNIPLAEDAIQRGMARVGQKFPWIWALLAVGALLLLWQWQRTKKKKRRKAKRVAATKTEKVATVTDVEEDDEGLWTLEKY
jgi:hypothetical protein